MKATVADENFDLAWVGYKDAFVNTFKSGVMYPLKDLIDEQAPELWNCVDSYMWEDSQINNEWYAVPNTQVCFYQYAFSVQKDLAETPLKEGIATLNELEASDMSSPLYTRDDNVNFRTSVTLRSHLYINEAGYYTFRVRSNNPNDVNGSLFVSRRWTGF